MNDLANLERRVSDLERQGRTWRRIALALAGAVVISLTGWTPLTEPSEKPGSDPSVEAANEGGEPTRLSLDGLSLPRSEVLDDLEVRQLRIVDKHGHTRIDMGITPIGPSVRLFDEKGNARSTLFLNDIGPGLSLLDKQGTTRAALSVLEDDAELRLMDADGESWAVLMQKEDRRMFVLAGEKNESRWGVLLHRDSAVENMSAGGRQAVTTKIDPQGAQLKVTGPEGHELFATPSH